MKILRVLSLGFVCLFSINGVLHAEASKEHLRKKQFAEKTVPAMAPIVANYDVYVGGLHLIEANILFEEQQGAYRTRVRASTHGFWGRMTPWNTVLESHGSITSKGFAPAEFYTRDEWNHKPKITKLHFNKNGMVTAEFVPASHDENRQPVTEAQKQGSLDPVTALLQILAHVVVEKNCNVTVPVFDGKRRFDVTGYDRGIEDIDEEDYGIFKGTARSCEAGFKMISGEFKDREHSRFWQKNDKEEGREPFHVWLAPVGPSAAELPVRLESSSVFGLIIVHLTNWHFATATELK